MENALKIFLTDNFFIRCEKNFKKVLTYSFDCGKICEEKEEERLRSHRAAGRVRFISFSKQGLWEFYVVRSASSHDFFCFTAKLEVYLTLAAQRNC